MNLSMNLFGSGPSEKQKIFQRPIQHKSETIYRPISFYIPLNDQRPALISLIEKNGGHIARRPGNHSIKVLNLVDKNPAPVRVASSRTISSAPANYIPSMTGGTDVPSISFDYVHACIRGGKLLDVDDFLVSGFIPIWYIHRKPGHRQQPHPSRRILAQQENRKQEQEQEQKERPSSPPRSRSRSKKMKQPQTRHEPGSEPVQEELERQLSQAENEGAEADPGLTQEEETGAGQQIGQVEGERRKHGNETEEQEQGHSGKKINGHDIVFTAIVPDITLPQALPNLEDEFNTGTQHYIPDGEISEGSEHVEEQQQTGNGDEQHNDSADVEMHEAMDTADGNAMHGGNGEVQRVKREINIVNEREEKDKRKDANNEIVGLSCKLKGKFLKGLPCIALTGISDVIVIGSDSDSEEQDEQELPKSREKKGRRQQDVTIEEDNDDMGKGKEKVNRVSKKLFNPKNGFCADDEENVEKNAVQRRKAKSKTALRKGNEKWKLVSKKLVNDIDDSRFNEGEKSEEEEVEKDGGQSRNMKKASRKWSREPSQSRGKKRARHERVMRGNREGNCESEIESEVRGRGPLIARSEEKRRRGRGTERKREKTQCR